MLYKDHGKRLGISSTQLLMNLHNNKAGRLVSISKNRNITMIFLIIPVEHIHCIIVNSSSYLIGCKRPFVPKMPMPWSIWFLYFSNLLEKSSSVSRNRRSFTRPVCGFEKSTFFSAPRAI